MSRNQKWFFAAALFTLAVDQLSKAAVRWAIPLGSSVPLIPNILHLTHTQNPGAAFGLFSNASPFLVVVALFTIGLLLWLGRQGFDRRRFAVATGLMLGGAAGNLADRLRFGAVTDFIDLRVWPIFNFADTALTVGALLFLWWSAVVTPKTEAEATAVSAERGETHAPAESQDS